MNYEDLKFVVKTMTAHESAAMYIMNAVDSHIESLPAAKPIVSGSGALYGEIERLIGEYRESQLHERFVPFHYEAEISAGFTNFLEWLKSGA